MRSGTAALLCFVILAVMFGLPVFVRVTIVPSLEQDLNRPVPIYEQMLLEIAHFCMLWKWIALIPVGGLGLYFTIVELTKSPHPRR